MWSLGEAFAALIAAWYGFQLRRINQPGDVSVRNFPNAADLDDCHDGYASLRLQPQLESLASPVGPLAVSWRFSARMLHSKVKPRLAANQALFIFSGISFAIVANLTFLPAGIGPAMITTVLLVRFLIFSLDSQVGDTRDATGRNTGYGQAETTNAKYEDDIRNHASRVTSFGHHLFNCNRLVR